MWTSLKLAWCWRAIANGYLARTLPTIIFAASAFCAFTIAGGFTSSISSGIGNDVLIDSTRCGLLANDAVGVGAISLLYPFISQSLNNAANYAQQCYPLNTMRTSDCTTFVKGHIEFNSVLNASCPFSGNLCRSNDSNLLLDSGLISSEDLGLNTPSSQRMFYRETLQCAPLRTDGFVGYESMDYTNYTTYSYGPAPFNWALYNWTYQAEDLDAKYGRDFDNPWRETTKGFSVA